MKLTSLSNPTNSADHAYNIIAQGCSFHKDQNNELYLVSNSSNSYQLIYLSNVHESKQYIRQQFFTTFKKTISNVDVLATYEMICALAHFNADHIPVYSRIAQLNDVIFYDLQNESNDVVRIDSQSVTLVSITSLQGLFFYRDQRMKPQVLPSYNSYSVMDFVREFCNITFEQQLLFAVYLCATFFPDISHSILIVEGEKGSGKTTLLRKICEIVNPVTKDLFHLSNNCDNLVTTLSNNYLSIFDNVGKLSDATSNIFCQASTGGTLVKRKLYSDNTEISINIKRIVAINGVNLEISQSDLLDRAILIKTKRIKDKERRSDKTINASFYKYLPSILADIFNILSKALAIYPNIKLEANLRMADFCEYGYAIAEAIQEGSGEIFLAEYRNNMQIAVESIVDENPLLECLKIFADKEEQWTGTMTELLHELKFILPSIYIGKNLPPKFPTTPNALSRKLNSHDHELHNLGIKVSVGRSKKRYVVIKKV